MINFKQHKIIKINDELALELKKAREKKKVSIEEASRDTKILPSYLKIIESGEFDRLPRGMYRKKILKEYGDYLSLDLRSFIKDLDGGIKSEDIRQVFFQERTRDNIVAWPKFFKMLFCALAAMSVIFYLAWQVNKIYQPPKLEVYSPKEDRSFLDSSHLAVAGMSEPEVQIMINGEMVFVDNEGKFFREVDLNPGENVIYISAKTKHGRENKIEKYILVK